MKVIASRENKRYAALTRLARSSRARKLAGLSLLEGSHLIEAYRLGVGLPDTVVVSRSGLENPEIQRLLAFLRPLQPLLLGDGLFRELSAVETPTGILAAVKTPRPEAAPALNEPSLLLDGLQDPGNLGSILRSAAAAGIRQIVSSPNTVHAWSPRVLRAGMGAHFALQIHEQIDLSQFVAAFRGRVIAATQTGAISLFEADLTGCVAFLFGNEGNGITPALLAEAQLDVAIPMAGGTESLNVAAAAAICVFERVRQTRLVGKTHPCV